MVTFSVRLLVRQSVQLSAEEITSGEMELLLYEKHMTDIIENRFLSSSDLLHFIWKEMSNVLKIE